MVAFNSDDTKNEDYSSSEEDEETAQEKRLRLAKKYIEDLKKEGMLCSKIVCVWFYFYKIRCRKFALYMWYWTKKHIIYKMYEFHTADLSGKPPWTSDRLFLIACLHVWKTSVDLDRLFLKHVSFRGF